MTTLGRIRSQNYQEIYPYAPHEPMCTRTLTYTDRYHIPRVLTDKENRSRFFGLTWSLEQTYQLIGPRLGGKVPDGGYNQIHAHTPLRNVSRTVHYNTWMMDIVITMDNNTRL